MERLLATVHSFRNIKGMRELTFGTPMRLARLPDLGACPFCTAPEPGALTLRFFRSFPRS